MYIKFLLFISIIFIIRKITIKILAIRILKNIRNKQLNINYKEWIKAMCFYTIIFKSLIL